jgi:hypothetical protein
VLAVLRGDRVPFVLRGERKSHSRCTRCKKKALGQEMRLLAVPQGDRVPCAKAEQQLHLRCTKKGLWSRSVTVSCITGGDRVPFVPRLSNIYI